jgi:hypothetical protein
MRRGRRCAGGPCARPAHAGTTPGSARGCPLRSVTRCSENDLLLEGLLERRLDITHRQPAQERADHQRIQRMRHALAQHQALEPRRLGVADPRTLQLDRAAGRLDPPRLIAVAMGHGLFAALIPCPAQEPAVLSACCKINQAPSRPTVSIGSTCSSTASNASSSCGETARWGLLSPCARTSISFDLSGQRGYAPALQGPREPGRDQGAPSGASRATSKGASSPATLRQPDDFCSDVRRRIQALLLDRFVAST